MKLVASLVVRNEADRYLSECLEHLLGFCDEIRVVDDGSTDGSAEVLAAYPGVETKASAGPTFFQHEGLIRQELLEWTMEGRPSHILAIDADEFVSDGQAIRDALEGEQPRFGVWKLRMSEVWRADRDNLWLRADGAWGPRPIGILYAVPPNTHNDRTMRRHWRMSDKPLACGRTPVYVTQMGNRTVADPVCDILHFGWANRNDRAARHARYIEHDGGAHHASKHLDSIMWDDARVKLTPLSWPRWPSGMRSAVYARANR